MTPQATTLVCKRCGRTYDCDPAGDCWCKALPPVRPVPTHDGARCLCPCEIELLAAREHGTS